MAIVYAQTRHFQFVNWDDPTYVTSNPMVLRGLSWRSVVWAFTTRFPYWHPVTWLSHLFVVSLFGADAGMHHVVNAAGHAANSVILFWVLRRITGDTARSAALSAIFAVHPLHVESVAWVTERKDVLSGFFILLALWAYANYVAHRSWPRYFAVAVAFMLALMSKPMVVTFPVLLLALDYWPLRRARFEPGSWAAWRAVLLEKIPLLGMAMLVGLLTVRLQLEADAMPDLTVLSPGARVARGVFSYIVYAGQAAWPVNLAAFYPLTPVATVTVAVSGLLLAMTSYGAVRCRARHPYVLVGVFWYLVALSPVIGILQAGEQAHADRFMYLALVGFLFVAVWGGADLLKILNVPPLGRIFLAVVATAVLVALAVVQTATWHDSFRLWTHALEVTSGNYKAYEQLGEAESEIGHLEIARAYYQKALDTAPSNSPLYDAALHNDLGLVLVRLDRPADAVPEFGAAVRLDPLFALAHMNLANALATTGHLGVALDEFQIAIRQNPSSADAYVELGNVLLEHGETRQATVAFRAAIRLTPDQPDAHNGLGAAELAAGDAPAAAREFREALRLRPRFPPAEVNLARALISVGRVDEARQHLQIALQMAPTTPGARELLARLDKR